MLPSTVDNSQISRSTSEAVNTGFRRKLALGQVSKIDFVFPLVDNICQHTSLSSLISTLVVLFVYCQLMLTSLWPVTVYWENEGLAAADEMSIVRTVLWFTERQASVEYIMIGTIVVGIVCVVCYGWLIFVLSNYNRTHRFEKWALYPARWAIEIISPIMFHPSAALAGAAAVVWYLKPEWVKGALRTDMFAGRFEALKEKQREDACEDGRPTDEVFPETSA